MTDVSTWNGRELAPETRAEVVQWIHEDRRDQAWTLEKAERLVAQFEAWTRSLGQPVSDADEQRAALWLDSTFFRPGRAATVYARMGTGKTHLAAWLTAQIARFRPGWDVYTNIPFAWDYLEGLPRPPNVHRVRSMSELLRGISNSMLANRRSAPIIDEFDQAHTSHQWQEASARSWTKFMFVERHFRVRGPVLVHHDFDWIPRPLRKGDLGSLFRMFRIGGEFRCAERADLDRWWVIPPSAMPFGTLALSGFTIDVDVEELEAGLVGNHLQVARQVLDYLDEREAALQAEAEANPLQARTAHRASVAAVQRAQAEENFAWLQRQDEIMAGIREGRSRDELVERFGASRRYLAQLEAVVRIRDRPSSQEPVPAEGA